ncbi:glycosyltransferase [Dolichospermum flos-aquae]|uniref:Glycosyltransferase n=1 Tax=Dolichospermum flos-aquae LEGE 04289 TaxID=1828708 RepID=A0ACC5PZG1_DOLFA|nr:glycosyltransferase [Dolichospermum flos-aquae]MBE9218229.1 glycosyltransferase [Dolichospermum flos-aquae LEGE 04289]
MYIEFKQCPFCKSKNLKQHQKRLDDIWVLLCQDCGLGFVEKYSENLPEIYSLDYYEKRGIGNNTIGYTNYKEIKHDYFLWSIALVAITKKKGSLFDLGCSNGLFLDLAKSHGLFPLVGLELNQDYAQICQEKGYKVFSEDFITFNQPQDQKYDVVTAWAVLEHIPQLLETLTKIKSLLNQDGWFFFEVPCLTFTARDEYWYSSSLEHIYYFTEKSIQNILNEYFCGNYSGKVVAIQNFGATYVGVASVQYNCDSMLNIVNTIFQNKIEILTTDNISINQITHALIFSIRYLEDISIANKLLNLLTQYNQSQLTLSDHNIQYLTQQYTKLYQDNLSYLEAKTYFIQNIERLEYENLKLQNELSAFKTSKFWKIREKWFQFRQSIGLKDNSVSITLKGLIKSLIKKITVEFQNPNTVLKSISQKIWPSEKPLVSVIIPCFNYGQYVEEAIDSILRQTFQDFEIIVVDGGSTDNSTVTTLKYLQKPKTKIYYRKGRHLVGDNRNFGIQKAKGKYICCLDADDKIKSTYLEKALFLLEVYAYDIVSTSVQCFGNSIETWNIVANPTLAEILKGNQVSTVAVFSKQMWEKANGYHDYGIGKDHISEDWDLWVRMMALGARVINISESLMLYRIHDKHTSLSNHPESLSFKDQAKTISYFNQKYLTPEAYKRSWNNNQTSYQVIDGSINLTQSYLAQTKENNKLKILFALPFVITGGADTILLQIAKYLSENNFDISIITTIKTDPKFGDNTNKYEQITQEIYHLYNFLDSQGKWKDFVYYYLESRQINILFIVGSAYFYDLLPDIKRDFPHLKVVDQLFNEYGHITNNRKYAELIDMNILASQVIEDILLQEYQESKSKTRVIVHGVDTQKEFNSININQKLIRDIIPNGKFIVSYMGRFSEEKCPLKFVEIVDKLRDNKDIYFLMLGNGPEYDSVKVKISELGLDDKIYAPGFVYDNRPFLKTTKLLIIPSRIEGIPIILMEGLSLGVPVIASKIGGIPDIIIDGYNGFVCDPNNPDEFANKIIKIYSDKNLQNQLKTNARTYAEENLDITKMNNEYINVFLSLLKENEL